MSNCLGDTDLERYLAGELPSGQHATVASHLQDCPSCSSRFAALQSEHEKMVNMLRGLGPQSGDLFSGTRRAESPMIGPEKPAQSTGAFGLQIEGYDLQGEIHRGGQGVVYRAVQRGTNRAVAIKVLLEGPAASIESKKRFEREVDLAARLRHPGIITVFHSGETNDGRQFYVMDFIDGAPLDRYVRENKLPLSESLKIFEQVCRAVHYAHQRGIIHRDLKPSNVLVDAEGSPRVLDFGLAKMVTTDLQTQVSLTGQVFGTLPYMSPEQATGRQDQLDARTDIYSLGVMLYQMLTGQFPYPVTGSITEVLKTIAEAPPERPSRVWKSGVGVPRSPSTRRAADLKCPIDEEVETITLKCLSKEPERRYQTAEGLAADLARYLAGEPIQAKRDSHWYVIRKSIPRYKASIALAATVVVIVGATIGFKIQRDRMNARMAEQRAAERELVLEQCRDAIMLLDANRLDELLDRSKDLDLDPGLYHCYRGCAHFIRLEDEEAIREADEAVRLRPDISEAHYLRAGVLAYRRDFLGAMKEFGNGQKKATGTSLDLAFQGLLKSLLGMHDSAMSDMDLLVSRQHGSAAVLFVRGFARWLRLLNEAPVDLNERRKVAELALSDFDASAALYPKVAFMFDIRADIHDRLFNIYRADGDTRRAEEQLVAQRQDAEAMTRLGAAGNGFVALSCIAMSQDDYAAAARNAQQAYDSLRNVTKYAAANRNDALEASIQYWILASFALGDDDATRTLARRLESENPSLAGDFSFGFTDGYFGEPEAIKKWIEKNAGDSKIMSPSRVFGLWTGLAAQGRSDAAHFLATRAQVNLTDRLGIYGSLIGYFRAELSAEALMKASGKSANLLSMARFVTALVGKDREAKLRRLRKIRDLGQPGGTPRWADALIYRAKNDPTFLRHPFARAPKTATSLSK